MGEDTFKFLSFGDRSLLHGLTYNVGYALSQNKSTSGSGRPEFIANTTKSYNFNDDFGPSGLDRLHNLSIGASLDLIGGFRLDQTYKLSTSPPVNLFVPNNVGAEGIFTADLNGDGGVGGASIRNELLPGTNIGAFGRSVGSISELNKLISDFNANFAGRLTPQGQRLVSAGIFTQSQMAALGGVIQAIPLVPSGNPDPFHTRFYADYRLSRPIKIWKENWLLEPSFSVFNVFNNAAKGTYAGLDGTCGALNHDYAADPGCDLGSLDRIRGLAVPARRQLQFGIRFSF